jgi:4-hydroxybenzoate polyprenyltransferase
MSFAAQLDSIPNVAWILYLAVMLWALVYDTMYAMVDKDDDLKIGVKSTAILFGNYDRHIMGALQIMILLLLFTVGQMQHLGGFYYASLIIGAGFSVYQQMLIFHREKTNCFKAFLNNNWFGLVIFVGMVLDYGVR